MLELKPIEWRTSCWCKHTKWYQNNNQLNIRVYSYWKRAYDMLTYWHKHFSFHLLWGRVSTTDKKTYLKRNFAKRTASYKDRRVHKANRSIFDKVFCLDNDVFFYFALKTLCYIVKKSDLRNFYRFIDFVTI
jgi:hypothetical protein